MALKDLGVSPPDRRRLLDAADLGRAKQPLPRGSECERECRVAVHGERRPAGGSALGGDRNPQQHSQLHRGRHGGRPRCRGRTGPDQPRPPCRAADRRRHRHRRHRPPPTPPPTADPTDRRPTDPPTTDTTAADTATARRHQGTTRRSRSQRNRHTTSGSERSLHVPGHRPGDRRELLCRAGRVRESAARFSLVCRQGTGRPSSVGAEKRTARRDPARAPDRTALAPASGGGRASPTRRARPAPPARGLRVLPSRFSSAIAERIGSRVSLTGSRSAPATSFISTHRRLPPERHPHQDHERSARRGYLRVVSQE